eukprot:Skav206643  [mRNA]  locus=scaffold5599:35854:37374:- [translate_table: standard]
MAVMRAPAMRRGRLARGRGAAKAKAHPGGLRRRPAGSPGMAEARGDPLAEWQAGRVVKMIEVPLEELMRKEGIVIPKAVYYKQECQIAGVVTGTYPMGEGVGLKFKACGTSHEGILRLQSGQPALEFRIHRCEATCTQDQSADDFLHGLTVRKLLKVEEEEGWARNLEKAAIPEEDELAGLRARAEVVPGVPPAKRSRSDSEEKDKKSKKKKKKKKAKEAEKEKKENERKKGEEESGEGTPLDGSKPRAASKKSPRVLFEGTGMDLKESIRAKVMRRAKRSLSKKEAKETSSSSSSSSSASFLQEAEETIFAQATKVRKIAESFPGVLAHQALGSMRRSLLAEMGLDHGRGAVAPVALQYYRQILARRAQGPVAREQLTLATSIDALVRGQVCLALDTMVQRLKSTESSLEGVHWSISQRLEIAPQEGVALAGTTEIKDAQREAYTEHRTKLLATQADGRGPYGRGQGKGKSGSKHDGKKGEGKRQGKNSGGKNDTWKKKEETPSK